MVNPKKAILKSNAHLLCLGILVLLISIVYGQTLFLSFHCDHLSSLLLFKNDPHTGAPHLRRTLELDPELPEMLRLKNSSTRISDNLSLSVFELSRYPSGSRFK